MARKKKYDYYEALERIARYAVEYSEELASYLEANYSNKKEQGKITPKETLEKLTELHEIEDKADDVVHEVTAKLAVEFMTPIEREDILALVNELDDIVDEIDDVLQRMYMYNLKIITPEIVEMAKVVAETTRAVEKACKRLANYKKAKTIKEQIDKVHELEDNGDVVYIKSVHSIHVAAEQGEIDNPLIVAGLTAVLQTLERCCDACEEVADTMVIVVMKNN